jgi:hypothetical protein
MDIIAKISLTLNRISINMLKWNDRGEENHDDEKLSVVLVYGFIFCFSGLF